MRRFVILTILAVLLAWATPTFSLANDQNMGTRTEEIIIEQAFAKPLINAPSPDSLYQFNRYSINAAGAINDSSTSYKLGFSLGQPVVGTASSASYQMGTGFWSDLYLFRCGDANRDGEVNVGDVVFLINYIFKGGPPPEPVCAGDANGDGSTNVGDAVYLIAYTFSGGPPPVANCCP